jgi:hypothetical protein
MDNNNHLPAKEAGTKTAHEYIREILPFRYQECGSCGFRTDLICIRCGYCYSCHWKKEKEERSLLENRITRIFPPPIHHAIKKVPVEDVLEQHQPVQESRQQRLIIDVYGRTSEPICSYHGCDHKFSVHGVGGCKCKHPSNKALGAFNKHL